MTFVKELWTRSLKPRYGIAHLVSYTLIIVLLASVLVRQYLWHAFHQTAVFMAEDPIPDVRIVQDKPLVHRPNVYLQEYDFTTDWFTYHVPVWEAVLSSFKGRPDLRYLEIGLYEGRSAVWMLENILTHPTARMTGLDVFDGPIKERYFANIQKTGAEDKVTTMIDYSRVSLHKLPLESFDIVYIDGSHNESDVLEDAVLSWRLLKEDGILIFDDYDFVGFHPETTNVALPKVAIEGFYKSFERELEVIHNSHQLILRKNASPVINDDYYSRVLPH